MRKTVPAKTQMFCDLCGKEINGRSPKTRVKVQRRLIVALGRFSPVFDDVELDLCWECDSEMFQYLRDRVKLKKDIP